MNEQDGTLMNEFDSGQIYVNAEGDWFYQGNRIIREDILEFFYDHLTVGEKHSYAIVWKNQRCALEVDDTPFVVSRVDRRSVEGQMGEQFVLSLKHLSRSEVLDPGTLRVGDHNVLYARVRSGRFLARFSRPAYYQLAAWINEDAESGEFYLDVNGERHPVLVQA